MEYMCHKWPRICSTCRKTSRSLPHLCLITGFVTRLTQRDATSSAGTAHPSGVPEFTPGFSGVRVTRFLVLCVCLVDRCLCFCPFSFGHCVICPSSICGFWLLLWYLVTPLISNGISVREPVRSEQELMRDLIWKRSCYDLIILYFTQEGISGNWRITISYQLRKGIWNIPEACGIFFFISPLR
jgi:hypothetical protein